MATSLSFQDIPGKRKRGIDEDGGDRSQYSANESSVFLSSADESSFFLSDQDHDETDADDNFDGDGDEDDLTYNNGESTDIKTESEDLPEEAPAVDASGDGNNFEPDPDAKYSKRREQYPKAAAYDGAIPKLKETLIGIVQETLGIIGANPCDTAYLAKWNAKAPDLLHIPKPQPVKIALLGDSGAGKSSLLNSVVDIPDLARALGSCESCTCVATEYRSSFPEQKKRFAARVVYFDNDASAKLMYELADGYVSAKFEEKEGLDAESLQQYQRCGETALKTFRALFCKHKEFASDEAAEKYLRRLAVGNNRTRVVMQLQQWCTEILKEIRKAQGNQAQCWEADEKNAFAKLMDPMLNSNHKCDGVSIWPLVKHVTIAVKDSRVLENVTIADLPGISDTDVLKVNSTLDYMRTCQAVWIVAPINRIVTSTTVDTLLRKYEERYRGKINIIATRCDDDVNSSLALHLKDKGVNLSSYQECCRLFKEASEQVSATNRIISSRMRALNTAARAEKVGMLKARLKVQRRAMKKAANKRLCALVEGRNQWVTNGINEVLTRLCPEKVIPKVFCVSNMHYLTLKGLEESGSFQLSPEGTGIPALRRYVYELAAPGLLQAMEDYIEHHFTVFLKSLGLWVHSRYVPNADKLLAIVEKPQARMHVESANYRESFKLFTKDLITEPLLAQASEHSAGAAGLLELKRKDRHPATLKAFMRRGGNHKTKACPRESWNEHFLVGAVHIVDKGWKKVNKHQQLLVDGSEEAIVKAVKSMLATIKKDKRAAPLELKSFDQLIKGQIVGIKNVLRDHQKDLKQDLANIKLDATQDRHSGFFTQAMHPAYEKCREDQGNGTTLRCLGYLNTHLKLTSYLSPFSQNATLLASAINGHTDKQCERAETKLQSILVDIYEHFDGMIAEEMADPSEAPVRKALKKHLKTAGETFAEVEEELQKIKAKYEKVSEVESGTGIKDKQSKIKLKLNAKKTKVGNDGEKANALA